jgi:hypothetical protein
MPPRNTSHCQTRNLGGREGREEGEGDREKETKKERKVNYRPISFFSTHANLLNKIPAGQIQKHIINITP